MQKIGRTKTARIAKRRFPEAFRLHTATGLIMAQGETLGQFLANLAANSGYRYLPGAADLRTVFLEVCVGGRWLLFEDWAAAPGGGEIVKTWCDCDEHPSQVCHVHGKAKNY